VRPQRVVLVSYPTEGLVLLRQARETGVTQPIIAAGAIYSGKTFLELSAGSAENMEVILPAPPQSEAAAHFRTSYDSRYDTTTPVNHYSARAYDALRLLVTRKCSPPSGECLKEALSAVKTYEGAAASYTFDENGDAAYALKLFRFSKGEFVASE
jgi:branched-chain amino acid transport system substrate-binding protein